MLLRRLVGLSERSGLSAASPCASSTLALPDCVSILALGAVASFMFAVSGGASPVHESLDTLLLTSAVVTDSFMVTATDGRGGFRNALVTAGSGPGDSDSDGIIDPAGNCPATASSAREAADRGAVGDACDASPSVETSTLFARGPPGGFDTDIWRIDSGGGNLTHVDSAQGHDEWPAVAAARFMRAFGRLFDSWFSSLDGSSPGSFLESQPPVSPPDSSMCPLWSRKGERRHAVEKPASVTNALVVDRFTSTIAADAECGRWSPDGSEIVYFNGATPSRYEWKADGGYRSKPDVDLTSERSEGP